MTLQVHYIKPNLVKADTLFDNRSPQGLTLYFVVYKFSLQTLRKKNKTSELI